MDSIRKSGRINIVVSAPKLFVWLLFLSLSAPITAHAASASASYPFTQGSARLSVFLGGGTAFNQDYTIIGLGAGYYVADGVEVGLDAETWTGNTPHIEQVSPQVRYVFDMEGSFKPYAGAFYRRTHIESYRDADSVGARAGVFFLAGKNAYIGGGLVLDNHLNCDRTVYAHCTETYPELLVAFVF